jgi:hypothetical protein
MEDRTALEAASSLKYEIRIYELHIFQEEGNAELGGYRGRDPRDLHAYSMQTRDRTN